jgi:hypothetical protein
MAQDRDHWRALVSTVMKKGEFLDVGVLIVLSASQEGFYTVELV